MSKTTKLTAAERSRRYRERIKLDKERNEDYKRKLKERNAKRLKRGDMPKRILQRVRAKEKEYVRGKRESERKNKFPLSNSGSSATTPACATPGSISLVAPELSTNEAEMLPTPTELNIIKKQKKKYTNQLKQRNKQLQLQIKLLKNRLKESERGKQKCKKRCQRFKKKVQEKSNKVLSASCNNLKQSLANFREKYKDRTSIYPLMGLKILKRYRLKKLIATKKKVIKKSRTCMSKINAVKNFFIRDDVSRACAGKKETVTSGKIKKQKRYLCDTMKNLYEIFKSENIGIDLSYITFTRLKPFFIKKPSASDRDTCACIEHANIDLKVFKLFQHKAITEKKTAQLLKEIVCNSESALCAWGLCKTCKTKKNVVSKTNSADMCKWFQWEIITEERLNKKTAAEDKYNVKVVKKLEKVSTLADLTHDFQKDMIKFKKHSFNVKNQYNAYRFCKDNLRETEVLIHIDFSENYLCKLSQEVQMFHFGASRNQASLHTGLLYFKKFEKPISFCKISESLNHGPGAIWAHLSPVFNYIKECSPETTTLHFFSDGPSSQYKQKNNFFFFCNRIFEENFKCATWSFFEKSHGKGAADGVGAVIKRTADALVAHGLDIADAEKLYHSLLGKTNVELFYVTPKEISNNNKILPKNIKTVPGTRDIHQVITRSRGEIIHRNLSCFCNTNNWLTGKLCYCHKLNQKVAKIGFKKTISCKIIYSDVYTDSD